MTSADIVKAITSGAADDNLTAVFDAYKARSRYLRTQEAITNQAELAPGTRVRIAGGIRPRYLVGIRGTVSPRDDSPKPGFLMVDIDESEDTGRFGHHVRVPANCLARVS
jgi:hypothetical protein